ncbi:MAG TPA: penicillin-binding protein 1C [Thermodesulfobacteriota bacterium]|nr:penicillin-binding protein 1C [Thermodesulfobacteriota bacterium]
MRRAPTVVVTDKDGNPVRFFLPRDEHWRLPIRLEDISPDLIKAVIASEDRWFHYHPGINPFAVIRALYTNIKAGKVVSGASTIPMQIARISNPKPRTLLSKLEEGFRALQLKWHLNDSQLIEIYLNITPYGGNIEGIGAASYFYLGKDPRALSPADVALLTVLPRSPTAYDPVVNPSKALGARNRVLMQLQKRGVFTASRVKEAMKESVPMRRRNAPFNAPHFTQFAWDKYRHKDRIETTLDLSIQKISEESARRRIEGLRGQGIDNLAIVVIENKERKLRAMVGSSDFFEKHYAGQVNNALARRSPGSALKPFLYAMALDRGLVIPATFMLDIPTDFSGYVPKNYDGVYRGQVTMREALIRSLNVPAARLLSEVGLDDFHKLLLEGGLTTLDRPVSQYGLPLILGSGEVTLLDLTNLYATLAQGGIHYPVRITTDESSGYEEKELFSKEASYLITQTLTELGRPDMPSPTWELTRDVPQVAWKTGTSYGHRDAWAVGYSGKYTIGVWVGNPSGRGQKGISGGEHAAPLLFDLFRAIEGNGAKPEKPVGLRLGTIEVCKESHMLPTPFCKERVLVTYIPGRSRIPVDNYSKQVFIDSETGEMLLGDCIAIRPHRAEIINTYPPELVAWWRAEGRDVPSVPPLSPFCKDVPPQLPPKIVSPDEATPYRMLMSTPTDYQKVQLIARTSPEVERLYWYQDGKLVASTKPDVRLFIPLEIGVHQLVVVDCTGRSDGITYRVEGDERVLIEGTN